MVIGRFPAMVRNAYEELAPHKICAYIYEMANAFNHFYHETKILTEEDADKKAGYIALLKLTKEILETCIDLLGFDAPERYVRMMNWKMWQKCVGKMGKKLPIFLFIFILLYVIGSLICYPMLTKRHVLKQKEKYAEQAAKETVDRSASVRCLDDNTQALVYRLALIESAQRELIMTTFDMSDGESGQDLMAAMLQAADRGVRIRLMVESASMHG